MKGPPKSHYIVVELKNVSVTGRITGWDGKGKTQHGRLRRVSKLSVHLGARPGNKFLSWPFQFGTQGPLDGGLNVDHQADAFPGAFPHLNQEQDLLVKAFRVPHSMFALCPASALLWRWAERTVPFPIS